MNGSKKKSPANILKAMRAESIPAGTAGLWVIRKMHYIDYETEARNLITYLLRTTMATMHTDGECVMEDTPVELKRHLNFVLKAKGRVLVTGLGLGCVVRGLLTKDEVTKIVVIERDKDIIRLVAPHMPQDSRLRIIEAEAFQWARDNQRPFDYAWHDIWSDPDSKEEVLPILHVKLIKLLTGKVTWQGAWGIHREALRPLRNFSGWYEHS